ALPEGKLMSEYQMIERAALRSLHDAELWHGSDYELGTRFPIGALSMGTRLQLLNAIWHSPEVAGFVLSPGALGLDWLEPSEELAEVDRLYGRLRIEDQRIVGYRPVFIENEWEAWCIFAIPMAMIDRIYRVKYGSRIGNVETWVRKIDPRLSQIATLIYDLVPFELAIIAEEGSAMMGAGPITSDLVQRYDHLIVPDALFQRMHVSPVGTRLTEKLWRTGRSSARSQSGSTER